jgi:hypothetical protein
MLSGRDIDYTETAQMKSERQDTLLITLFKFAGSLIK